MHQIWQEKSLNSALNSFAVHAVSENICVSSIAVAQYHRSVSFSAIKRLNKLLQNRQPGDLLRHLFLSHLSNISRQISRYTIFK